MSKKTTRRCRVECKARSGVVTERSDGGRAGDGASGNSADDGFRLISHVSRGLRGLWLGLPPAAKPAGDAAAANPHRADTYGLHGSDLGCRSGGKQAGKPLLPIRTWPRSTISGFGAARVAGPSYRAPSQAGPGNDINAGSPGFQKAPTRGPASLVAIGSRPMPGDTASCRSSIYVTSPSCGAHYALRSDTLPKAQSTGDPGASDSCGPCRSHGCIFI